LFARKKRRFCGAATFSPPVMNSSSNSVTVDSLKNDEKSTRLFRFLFWKIYSGKSTVENPRSRFASYPHSPVTECGIFGFLPTSIFVLRAKQFFKSAGID
jgi:hypothetical protein